MKTRILKVLLGEALLAEIEKGTNKSELAEKIGVSPQKLTAMIKDQWPYISRNVIERTADYLQLEVNEVFRFVPVEFWRQILDTVQCTFLRGAQDEKGNEQKLVMQSSDIEATNEVSNYLLQEHIESAIVEHSRSEVELLKRARSENCIVIGSPKSNAATEILLARFFNAEPYNPADENRYKIPFGFCWPDSTPIVTRSSLTCSAIARKRTKNIAGIAIKGGPHVQADYKEAKEFRSWSTKKGKDCGLVFIANKPFKTDRDVKLIVLAGFSGLGTVGAAKALIKDFRYLEPKRGESCVYGVVECWYSKAANSFRRSFKSFHWRVRVGGSSPIK